MQHTENSMPDNFIKENLHKYIDSMDDFQARLTESFIKTLFNLSD